MKVETDRHRNEWGARDPYFSVLGVDRFRGVGRLTLPLARRFERVAAVDAAETMRVEAACNIAEASRANVALCAAAAPGDPTGSGGAAGRKPDA